MKDKTALVLGAGGFIGSHLVKDLVSNGYWTRGVDLKHPQWTPSPANDFVIGDLRDPDLVREVIDRPFDEVYQLAADMGGAGYLFTGHNDADVMHNSALINLNVAEYGYRRSIKKLFYSSSACVYPKYNQTDPANPRTPENSVSPASPDSEYGWEKLFSERLYDAFHRNRGLDIRVVRFHNVYGPEGAWNDGREKAPAAICRKVAETPDGGTIPIWGPGSQTRSFMFIYDAIDGIEKIMEAPYTGPINLGSSEMISINDLTGKILDISGKALEVVNVPGPVGVMGRTSDNTKIKYDLNWEPWMTLDNGLPILYDWIESQVNGGNG